MNRMGFNNDGAEVVARRGAAGRENCADWASYDGQTAPLGGVRGKRAHSAVLGVNIGKTKVVPDDDEAAVLADYGKSARLLSPYADYLVVNVSSPNTPGLRNLQAVEKLQPLLEHVRRTADAATDHRVPLLVKIAPDLSDDDVLAVADLARAMGWTASSPPTPRSRAPTCAPAPRPSRRPAPGALRRAAHAPVAGGPAAAARPGRRRPDADRGRRHHHGRRRAPGSRPGRPCCRATARSSTRARCAHPDPPRPRPPGCRMSQAVDTVARTRSTSPVRCWPSRRSAPTTT